MKQSKGASIGLDFGVKGWIVMIITFFCILLDSSLINDSLNIVVDAFAGQNDWSSSLLLRQYVMAPHL